MDSKSIFPYVKHYDGEIVNGVLEVRAVADDGTDRTTRLPCRHLAADLGVFYIYMNGAQNVMIQSEMLPGDVTENDLYAAASDNLYREAEFCLAETEWGGLAFVCGGDFESCVLSQPELLDFAAQEFDVDYFICAPTRDVVLMVAANDGAKLTAMKNAALSVVDGAHAVTRQVLRYSKEAKRLCETGIMI